MKKIYFVLLCSLLTFLSCFQEPFTSGETIVGSYARMLTIGDFLYIIDDTELSTFDISDDTKPSLVERINVGEGIETIFFNGTFLFIGSNEGLYIYSIMSNGVPLLESLTPYEEWTEVLPCDPVVATDDIAYVTLSAAGFQEGGNCSRFIQINELRIFNIEDVTNPIETTVIPLQEPKGLALDDELLFVCEKNDGLLVFDVSIPTEPALIEHFPGFEAIDAIAYKGLLMVVNSERVIQFDYADTTNIRQISSLKL